MVELQAVGTLVTIRLVLATGHRHNERVFERNAIVEWSTILAQQQQWSRCEQQQRFNEYIATVPVDVVEHDV
jgi:hypothetical protein